MIFGRRGSTGGFLNYDVVRAAISRDLEYQRLGRWYFGQYCLESPSVANVPAVHGKDDVTGLKRTNIQGCDDSAMILLEAERGSNCRGNILHNDADLLIGLQWYGKCRTCAGRTLDREPDFAHNGSDA
jgi:hypothetical protein